jgi:hypothetical protein
MKTEIKDKLDRLGDTLVGGFQIMALFVIGGTIVWSSMSDYMRMIRAGRAGLEEKCDIYACILSLPVALTCQPPTSATQ